MTNLTRVTRYVGWLVLFGVEAYPASLPAQTLVTGHIRGNGRLLDHADVIVEPGTVQVQSDDSGAYQLRIGEPGMVRISVRAVGFHPASRRFVLAGGDTLIADFSLAAVPQQLDSITVKASAVPVAGKMQGFEERRRMGFGRFYTREFLAQREASPLANVLRLTPNLQLIRRPERCGGGYSVATGRSVEGRRERWMACPGSPMAVACYSPIYLDGVLFWGPGMPGMPPPDVDQFRIAGLEGIEVYRSVSEAPLQYRALASTCGVVLLWTRVGGG